MDVKTRHGNLKLPTFFPDGTIGVVRSVDSVDLKNVMVEGVVTSSFHLMVHGIKKDLHELMSWDGPVLTDSGGFQVFSLLRDNPKSGRVDKKGFKFNWNGEEINFTPEKSIQLQYKLGADILICLDQCTDPEMGFDFQSQAVERTVEWARRCKAEFEKLTSGKKNKPLLFAVIQGGDNRELRKYCAEELIKTGFDGYCYGGWPIDKKKVLITKILKFTADLMPEDKPKYALGVGKPDDIVKCFKMGYGIFDCVIPTREARHKRLYIFKGKPEKLDLKKDFYSMVSVNLRFENDLGPISPNCDCFTCKNFSRAYLFQLFKAKDTLAFRLATIHNLRFYIKLCEILKG